MPKLKMFKFKIEEALCDYVKSHGVKALIGNKLIEIAGDEISRIKCHLNGYYVGSKDYCVDLKLKLNSQVAGPGSDFSGSFCAFISQDDGSPQIGEPSETDSDIIVSKMAQPKILIPILSLFF